MNQTIRREPLNDTEIQGTRELFYNRRHKCHISNCMDKNGIGLKKYEQTVHNFALRKIMDKEEYEKGKNKTKLPNNELCHSKC